MSFCDHSETMIKDLKGLNDRCRDLYEEIDFLKDKLKTLLVTLADKGKNPLTPLVKANIKCKTLNPCELEIPKFAYQILGFLTLWETHYGNTHNVCPKNEWFCQEFTWICIL